MTPLVLVILALMWILVLVPPLMRSRTDGRPSTSIMSFQRRMSTLQGASPYARRPMTSSVSVPGYRTPPRPSSGGYYGQAPTYHARSFTAPAYGGQPNYVAGYAAGRPSPKLELKRRRLQVLVGLIGAAVVTFLGFVAGFSSFFYLHLVCDILLGGYVYVLAAIRRAELERAWRESWQRAA